jgi:hypothetical protein
VAEYEMVETLREQLIEKENYISDLTVLDNWYEEFYKGRRMLVLSEVNEYRRIYQWS